MKLKMFYDNKDDVPAEYAGLFTEKDGKFVLSEIEGMPAPDSVRRLEESLRKEREDHKATKGKLKVLDGIDADKLHEDLDELKELRALKETGSIGADEEKLAKLTDARVQREIAPIKRELERAKKDLGEITTARDTLSSELRSMKIRTAISAAALESKMVSGAVEDALLLADRVFEVDDKGNVIVKADAGFIPGTTPSEWFIEMKEKRAHWWPASTSGGSSGGAGNGGAGGSNPWSRESWNMTEQSRIYSEDPSKAKRMAEAAGSQVGAARPPIKAA